MVFGKRGLVLVELGRTKIGCRFSSQSCESGALDPYLLAEFYRWRSKPFGC